MRFIHIADVHLGNSQYGLPERVKDFGRAFQIVMREAIRSQPDAILLAGDLFDKAAVAPRIYLQATRVLAEARRAGIPVVAVEGNHDQARYQDEGISWPQVLSQEGYLMLLQPAVSRSGAEILPWDERARRGGYVDLGPLRVIGSPYSATEGAAWHHMVEAIRGLPRAPDTRFVVLLAHSGLEGEMDREGTGGLTHASLAPLRPGHVDYLALGHFHKPFERDGWIFNPGSLEHCSMEERQWAKGIYVVTVTEDGFTAEHRPVSPRPFFREALRVDAYTSPDALIAAARALIRAALPRWQQDGRAPVVEISLEGTLPFDRDGLDLAEIQKLLEESGSLLRASVSIERLSLRGLETSVDAVPRDVLERDVLTEIVRNDSRYSANPEAGVQALLRLKARVLEDAPVEAILEIVDEWLALLEAPSAERPEAEAALEVEA